LESEVRGQLDGPDQDSVIGEHLAPPAPAGIPFSTIRAGALRIDELWLVDDFGQSADLLGLTAARTRSSARA